MSRVLVFRGRIMVHGNDVLIYISRRDPGGQALAGYNGSGVEGIAIISSEAPPQEAQSGVGRGGVYAGLVEYARRYCGESPDDYCILRALFEHGEGDGVVVFGKSLDALPTVVDGVNSVLQRLVGGSVTITDIVNGAVRVDGRVAGLARLIWGRLSSGYTRIILKARSIVIPGVPRSVLGVSVNIYMKDRVRYYGYSIRLDRFIVWLLLGEGVQA